MNQQKIYVYSPTGGTALRSFGGKGTGERQVHRPVGRDGRRNGVVYATDEAQSRVQAFSTTDGSFLGKWGGAGTGPYQLRNPSGISHDAQGRVYVADSANDRIAVFDPATAKPAYQFSRPTLTLTSPANNSSTDVPLVVSGRVTDNRSIASVEVSVRDNTTGLWWDAATATWTATQTWGFAPYRGTPTDALWSWTFAGPQYGRTYHFEARARDTDNSLSSPVRTTDVRLSKPDNVAPETTLDTPAKPSTVPMGPIAIDGTASDNTGVAGVKYSVQHQRSAQWWTGSAWSTTQTWFNATVASPGATSTGWSATWTPPSAGRYYVYAAAVDGSGNQDATPADTDVTAELAGPDTTPANGTITAPKANQVLPLGPLTFSGRATDDTGVGWADVAIQNRDTGLWWNDVTQTWVTRSPGTTASPPRPPAGRARPPGATPTRHRPRATTASASGRATTTATSTPRRPG